MTRLKTAAVLSLAALVLLYAGPTRAADAPAAGPGGGAAHAAAHDGHDAGPVPPHGARWAGVMVVTILLTFLAAAAVGVSVRLVGPTPEEEMPPTHSHDEPPGASHHHGHSGTLNPEPDHGHASDHHH